MPTSGFALWAAYAVLSIFPAVAAWVTVKAEKRSASPRDWLLLVTLLGAGSHYFVLAIMFTVLFAIPVGAVYHGVLLALLLVGAAVAAVLMVMGMARRGAGAAS